LVVSGNISGLKYEEKRTKKSFFGKVFKWCFLKTGIFFCLQGSFGWG
jgi:hypothetical protein